jgi:peptidyl-prolyl cis-trans isomerase SurA
MRRAAAVLAVAAVILGASIAREARARLVDGVVAVVNGEPVTFSEVRTLASEGLGIPEGDADAYLREEKDRGRILRLIESIVETVLVRQELERQGQPVADKEIERALESVRRANNLDPAQFREALARDNLTVEMYRRRLRWQLERGAIVRAKKFREVTVTEDELRAFFRDNAERYASGAEVRLEMLTVPMSSDMGEERRVSLRIAAQQAQEFVRQGKTLTEAASLIKTAAPEAEAMTSGFVLTEDLLPEMQKEVRRLKTGQASSLFLTEAGAHIVRVLERRGGVVPDFAAVRDAVADELADRRSEKAYADIVAELRKNATIDVRL